MSVSDSICRQTLKDIEIICVNDGSTDGSLAIINEYAERDSRIVVLDGPNGGYGKGMNRGSSTTRRASTSALWSPTTSLR